MNVNDDRGFEGIVRHLCVSCRRRPELAPSPVRESDVCGHARGICRTPGLSAMRPIVECGFVGLHRGTAAKGTDGESQTSAFLLAAQGR